MNNRVYIKNLKDFHSTYVVVRTNGEKEKGWKISEEHPFAYYTMQYGWCISMFKETTSLRCIRNLWPETIDDSPECIKAWREEFIKVLDILDINRLNYILKSEITIDGTTYWHNPETAQVWEQFVPPVHAGFLHSDNKLHKTIPELPIRCSNSGCGLPVAFVCKCDESFYCGKECQKKHWPVHSSICSCKV